ncbi:cholinergic receptor, nicotinic, beta [Ciona intestinalis]
MTTTVLLVILFCLLEMSVSLKNSTFFSKEAELVSILLDGYSARVRPRNKIGKTKVNVGITLSQIMSLSEKSEVMMSSMYMTYTWVDPRFTWNASKYDGILVTRISVDRIWVPNIIIKNSKERNLKESLRVNALVFHNGSVQWLPPAIYKTSCTMDITLFPFDWQNCSMVFRSADHDQSEMIFGLSYGSSIWVDKHVYIKNGEWVLYQKPAYVVVKESDQQFQEVWFSVILRRKPQFYVLNMLLPCVMISILSCFVFHLPVVAGEKIGLSISLLLGDTIFVFLFAQRMPSTALTVPHVATYLLFSMLLLFLSIFCCVVVYNFHFRSNVTHEMPRVWKWLFFDVFATFLGLQQPQREEKVQSNKFAETSNSRSDFIAKTISQNYMTQKSPSEQMYQTQAPLYGFRSRHKRLVDVNGGLSAIPIAIKPVSESIKTALRETENVTAHFKKIKAQRKARHDWIYLAFILDRLLMWLYMLGFVVGSLSFVVLVATENYPENIVAAENDMKNL